MDCLRNIVLVILVLVGGIAAICIMVSCFYFAIEAYLFIIDNQS